MFAWIIASLVAFFVKGLCGFANTLVFSSILGFVADNVNISPVELILGYPTNLILIWKNRKRLNLKIVVPLSLIIIATSIIGAVLLKSVDTAKIKIVFGVAVILIGIEILFRSFFSKEKETKSSKFLLIAIGVLSGLLCGLFGIGALLSAYIGRVTKTSGEFKANISAIFFAENTIRLSTYSLLGIISLASFAKAALLFPFALAGLFLGMKSASVLNEKATKILVILLLIISGFILVVKNI